MEKYRLNYLCWRILLITVVATGLILSIGSATAAEKGGKSFQATFEACPTAQITAFECFLKQSKFSGGPKLHVKLDIKNISEKPNRYRVSIFLPEGASAGGFYPRKGKPPVLKPGEVKSRTFPMYYEDFPDSLTIRVEEL